MKTGCSGRLLRAFGGHILGYTQELLSGFGFRNRNRYCAISKLQFVWAACGKGRSSVQRLPKKLRNSPDLVYLRN